ncbi:MAG: hypothetical protein K2X66_12155, partial [Cyanobacteria bacterium]|nr:hypothetical protein [Cyanobacteriota bacterium]
YLTRSDKQIKWLGIRPAVLPEQGYKNPRENIDCWSKRWVQKITGVFSHLNPFGKREAQALPTVYYCMFKQ